MLSFNHDVTLVFFLCCGNVDILVRGWKLCLKLVYLVPNFQDKLQNGKIYAKVKLSSVLTSPPSIKARYHHYNLPVQWWITKNFNDVSAWFIHKMFLSKCRLFNKKEFDTATLLKLYLWSTLLMILLFFSKPYRITYLWMWDISS